RRGQVTPQQVSRHERPVAGGDVCAGGAGGGGDRRHRVPVLIVAGRVEGDASGGEQAGLGADAVEQRDPVAVEQLADDAAVRAPDDLDAVPVVGLELGALRGRGQRRVQLCTEEVLLNVELPVSGRQLQRVRGQRAAVDVRVGAEGEVGLAVGDVVELHP